MIISKIRKYLSLKSALLVYKAMILPYFDYGDMIFTSSNIPKLKKLGEYHVRGLRICQKTQGKIDDKELFKQCKLSNLENRRTVHLRIKNKNKCIEPQENIITRENSGPKFNESFKRNVYYAGAIEWNNLVAERRNIKNYQEFKRFQKSWLLNTYLD